jgi:hypothetical protein
MDTSTAMITSCFNLYSSALSVYASCLPRFQDTLNDLRDSKTECVFGVNTDFKMPGHGRKIDEMTFKNGKLISALRKANLREMKGPHFSLALVDVEGMKEDYKSCLVATWAHNVEKCPTPTIFVVITNTNLEYAAFMFDVLERMVEYLWLTNKEDEVFPELKCLDYVEIIVHSQLMPADCATDLVMTGFTFDADTGMLHKGIALRALD